MERSPWTILLAVATATVLTRFAGPIADRLQLFKNTDDDLLSRRLPLAIILVLILKDVLPAPNEDLSLAVGLKVAGIFTVASLHLWKRNMFLSILGGTAAYVFALAYMT